MKAIQCASLIKSFGQPPLNILKSISFDVELGEFTAITGRSGSGKSTLLYTVSGLDDITSGEVIIFGKNVHTTPSDDLHKFRNTRMGFVFQFHYLLPELTSIDNILMPARKFKQENKRRERAMSLMDRFDVMHCKNKRPSEMSGGEQQRVAIARSLIMEPDLLFADEPTGNLDSVNGEKVMRIFEDINANHNTTILLVTHEADYAARAGRQIRLKDGEIEQDVKTKPPKSDAPIKGIS
jgi:ABC-type lipoprotein export system ATPase subunit